MGTLPEDWAGPGLFKRLQFVYLQGNIYLTGPLSAGWASPDAFPSLIEMCVVRACVAAAGYWRPACAQGVSAHALQSNQCTISLLSCSSATQFNCLLSCCRNLHWNNLTGTVPEEWGTEDAFPVLQNL